MKVKSPVEFYQDKVLEAVAKGSKQSLYRAAGYLRKVASTSIKYSKTKTSRPGTPPVAHTRAFKHSFAFAMEEDESSALVGMIRFPKHPTNPQGVPVPGIMERGGAAAAESYPSWIIRDAPPLQSRTGIAQYFLSIKKIPVVGKTNPVIAERTAANKKSRTPKFYRRWSPVVKKSVYVAYLPLFKDADGNARLADTAAADAVRYFGYSDRSGIKIAPRPFMRPALENTVRTGKVAAFFRDIL